MRKPKPNAFDVALAAETDKGLNLKQVVWFHAKHGLAPKSSRNAMCKWG